MLMGRAKKILFGLTLRNKGRSLISVLYRMVKPVDLGPKELLRSTASFCFMVYRLSKAGGFKQTVLYLKTSQVLLMQSLGGVYEKDSMLLGARVKVSRKGIPLFIPSIHRHKIMTGKDKYIRFWMTLTGFYRVLEFPGTLKISTITDPAPSINFYTLKSLRVYIREIFMSRVDRGRKDPGMVFKGKATLKDIKDGPLGEADLYHIGKSGPNVYFP